MDKKVLAISVGGILLFGLIFGVTIHAAEVKRYTIASGTMGGDWRIGMGAVVQLLNEKFKEKYFFTIAATAGGTENVRRMATGEYQSGLAHVFTMAEAWNSEGLFEGKKPFKEMRVLLRTTDQPLGVASLAKSPIRKFPDLVGKRVNLGPPGSGNLYVGTVVLKGLGIFDKVKVGHLNNTAAAEALRDGQIDAVMMPGAPFMSPSLVEISRSVDIRLIEPTSEEASKVVKEVPYLYLDVIPPNKAPGENSDRERKAFFWSVFWIALAGMPDEVIYDMLKVTHDNREDLGKVVGYWATASPSFASLEKLGIPYHSGAVKFWREKGIKFPPELAK